MSIELILLAVNINLVAFSTFLGDLVGQVFALLVLTVAAAEAAIGLAILVVYLPQPRLDRGRRHQPDEGLSATMYQAIVFLPLLGAILAGADRARRRARALSRRERAAAGRWQDTAHVAADHGAHAHAHARRACGARRSRAHGGEPAAAGSRAAELITTTLLLISMILSWIAFVAGRLRPSRRARAAVHLDHLRRPQGRLGAAHRHADRRDAGGGDDRLGARAPLFDRLHGRGPVPAALLRLSVAVHLRHADAGDGRQPGADVLRLGGRRPRELSADRLLVPQAGGQRRGDQGLRRQPRRRFRLRARHLRASSC